MVLSDEELPRHRSIETSSPLTVGWSLVVLFVLLGALVRGLHLDSNPPGLWQDEASTGLDAWHIWHTGHDRAQAFLPLISRSFGDYPLALYRYLDAPIVGLGGLTIANERAVASIFGVLFVIATSAVVRLCVGDRAAVAVALTGALCPTWIHFSRYGSEAILLPAFLTIGWLGIEFGVRRSSRSWAIWAGALALGLSAYTYHAVKLVLPIWMVAFLAYQYPHIRTMLAGRRWIHAVGPAVLFAVIVLPSAILAFTDDGQARGRTVLAWHHPSGGFVPYTIVKNYLSYFNLGLLFVRGGPTAAQSIPGLGIWNLVELPMMLAGFITAFRRPTTRRFFGFVLFWFLLGPLPGGVTYESENIGRAIAWLPAPQIFSAIGLVAAWEWAGRAFRSERIHERVLGGAAGLSIGLGWAVTAFMVFKLVLVDYPRVTEANWQFGITRAMQCALRHQTTERFIVSNLFRVPMIEFAQFHFAAALLEARHASDVWELGQRRTVGPNELYITPAHSPAPTSGSVVCTVVQKNDGRAVAFVYEHAPLKPSQPEPTLQR